MKEIVKGAAAVCLLLGVFGGVVGPDVIKKVQHRIEERMKRLAAVCLLAGASVGASVVGGAWAIWG